MKNYLGKEMTKTEAELQGLKPWDSVGYSKPIGRGYVKIYTTGHGYLVVPKSDPHARVAKKICSYGFVGKLAYYLEEDCEQQEFISAIA